MLFTGGGSGGHITPVLSVIAELKHTYPDSFVTYVGQIGDNLSDIPKNNPDIDDYYEINCGKLRRYGDEGLKQLLDFKTQYLNLVDVFRLLQGCWQSWKILGKVKPDVIFTRGGYVSVPVAFGAKIRNIPYITHDSDVLPSLANRIIGPWASLNLVSMHSNKYPYKTNKIKLVGIPISDKFRIVSPRTKEKIKKYLAISKYRQIICITGGGNGAEKINNLMIQNVPYLLKKYPDLFVIHISGRLHVDRVIEDYKTKLSKKDFKRVLVKGFVSDLYLYSAVADIVVARGGATNMAEFSAQAKACLVIPSKQLSWNVSNAKFLAQKEAIIMIDEDNAEQELRIAKIIEDMLNDDKKRQELIKNFVQYNNPNAAKDIVNIIINSYKDKDVVNS